MRIAVNALFLRTGRVGGSEIALRGMVNGLAAHCPGDQIHVHLPGTEAGRGLFRPSVVEIAAPFPALPRAARIAGEQTWLPVRLGLDGADVLWNAGFTAPLASPVPQVTTVFDTQHLRHPEHFRLSHRLAWRVLVDLAIARSRRVVCPSAATLADLAALRPRSAARLRRVPLGVEDEWSSDRDAGGLAAFRRRFELPECVAVCVATTHPHKGHETLLRCWRVMVDAGRVPPLLVLTGVTGFADRAVRDTARRLAVEPHVRHVGWIDRDDLRRLYGAASVVLLPSRFEGFGLPLLEAMAVGAPVVATDLPAFRETGGDHVRWVDGSDVGGWASAIVEVLEMSRQARRARVEAARLAAATWTWARAAATLRSVFEEAIAAAPSVDGTETRGV